MQWAPKRLHSKQDLDPFSRVCTAKPRDRQKTDAGIIDRAIIVGASRAVAVPLLLEHRLEVSIL